MKQSIVFIYFVVYANAGMLFFYPLSVFIFVHNEQILSYVTFEHAVNKYTFDTDNVCIVKITETKHTNKSNEMCAKILSTTAVDEVQINTE